MSAKLFEPCRVCRIFASRVCPNCKGSGFVEIGLTLNQLERLVRKGEALNRIAYAVAPVDLQQLADAAEWLDAFGHTHNSPFVRQARQALSEVGAALKDARGPLR
jgi:hypothetical protein